MLPSSWTVVNFSLCPSLPISSEEQLTLSVDHRSGKLKSTESTAAMNLLYSALIIYKKKGKTSRNFKNRAVMAINTSLHFSHRSQKTRERAEWREKWREEWRDGFFIAQFQSREDRARSARHLQTSNDFHFYSDIVIKPPLQALTHHASLHSLYVGRQMVGQSARVHWYDDDFNLSLITIISQTDSFVGPKRA